MTAESLNLSIRYGYLFDQCRLVSDAAANSIHLGRPWHPGGDPSAVAQVLVRNYLQGADGWAPQLAGSTADCSTVPSAVAA